MDIFRDNLFKKNKDMVTFTHCSFHVKNLDRDALKDYYSYRKTKSLNVDGLKVYNSKRTAIYSKFSKEGKIWSGNSHMFIFEKKNHDWNTFIYYLKKIQDIDIFLKKNWK